MIDSIEHNLGYFSDMKEAEQVVREYRIKLHGSFVSHG